MKITIATTLLSNQLCLSQTKNGTDKEYPKRYISEVYDPMIGKYRTTPIIFLEIGVRTGASAHLWAQYFENLEFTGIDNGQDVTWQHQSWVNGRKVKCIVADAYNHAIFRLLPDAVDIVIDDGPHSLESQKWTAKNYTSILNPEGYLFIEDIQGGRRYCDRIIRELPKSFKGCARVYDLRKISGEGDALLILIHNCKKDCSIPASTKNEMQILPRLLRATRYQEGRYILLRNIRKLGYKLNNLVG